MMSLLVSQMMPMIVFGDEVFEGDEDFEGDKNFIDNEPSDSEH